MRQPGKSGPISVKPHGKNILNSFGAIRFGFEICMELILHIVCGAVAGVRLSYLKYHSVDT